MENICFKSIKELEEYLQTCELLDPSLQGKQGLVYKKDNKIIKYFGPNPCFDTEHILQFKDIKVPNFYFANAGIEVTGKLLGCISDYAKGIDLREYKLEKEDIDIILEALRELRKNVQELSREKIRVDNDVSDKNTLYDNGIFRFIDTLGYYRHLGLTEDKVWALNIQKILNMLYKQIFPHYTYQLLKSHGFLKSSDLQSIYPEEAFADYLELIEKEINTPFKTTDEAAKLLTIKQI